MKVKTIVGHVGGRCKGESEEQEAWNDAPVDSSEIKKTIKAHLDRVYAFVDRPNDTRPFDEVEGGMRDYLFTLGRLFLAYFLALREERSEREVGRWKRRGYRCRNRERKHLNTFFGRVTFWRTYVRRPGGTGFHPLDLLLGSPPTASASTSSPWPRSSAQWPPVTIRLRGSSRSSSRGLPRR